MTSLERAAQAIDAWLAKLIFAAIEAAVAEERESCARLADREGETADPMIPMVGQYKAKKIAAVIRDRFAPLRTCQLKVFAAIEAAVVEEREACAEVAFQWEPTTREAINDLSAYGDPDAIADKVVEHIAAAIRARGCRKG